MRYVVFDLDQTLADVSSVYFFIGSLTMDIPLLRASCFKELRSQLGVAYGLWVHRVLEQEQSDTPLGILRPGILDIMTKLYRLKRANQLDHVVIYSNNGVLSNLHFVKDLIHEHLHGTLITDCIHWNHPLREHDKNNRFMTKSWATLQRILQEGPCQARTVEPSEVVFFDDMDHMNLQMALENYYQVPPYHMDAYARTAPLYQASLEEAQVNLSLLYHFFLHIFRIEHHGAVSSDMSQWMALLRRITPSVIPSAPDGGIQMMKDVIRFTLLPVTPSSSPQ